MIVGVPEADIEGAYLAGAGRIVEFSGLLDFRLLQQYPPQEVIP
jgi:hypothetical protein